jgi:hypothetical protein
MAKKRKFFDEKKYSEDNFDLNQRKNYQRIQRTMEIRRTPEFILEDEIHKIKYEEQPNYNPAKGHLSLLLQPEPSKILGIEGISGLDYNLNIFLEEFFDLGMLERITKKEPYYIEKKRNSEEKLYSLKRRGNILTLGIPIIAWDNIQENSNRIEIKRKFPNINYGIDFIKLYLEEKYGKIKFKEDNSND